MLKLPNSIEPVVMAENIVHLRDGIAAVDAKTLPATTTATTGQILKLTGENKTPAWADEYRYTPPAYSETEVNTGQKWIDGKEIYCKVITGTFPEITGTSSQTIGNIILDTLVYIDFYAIITTAIYRPSNLITVNRNSGEIGVGNITTAYSEKAYYAIVYYTKPTPGRAPEDSDQEPEPEEKKTTKKKGRT